MYHYMSLFTSIVLAATPSPAAQPSPSTAAGGLVLGSGVNPLFLVIAALAVLLLLVILVARLGGRRGRPTLDAPPPAPARFDPTDLDPAAETGNREIYSANPTPYIGVPMAPAAAPTYAPAPAPAPAPMPTAPAAVAPAPSPPTPPAPPPMTVPAAPPPLPQSSMPIDSPFAPEAPPDLPSSPPPLSPWAGAVPADAPVEPPPPPPPPLRAPEATRPEPPAAPVPLEIPPAPEPLPPRSFAPSSAPAATEAPFLTPFVDALPAVAAAAAPAPLVAPAPPVAPPQPEPVKPVAPDPPSPEAVAAAAAPPVAAAAGAPANASGAPPVILIIEDDERIQKFYSILFSAKGYKVESASDGVEGVDMATSLLPDLILLDVMMPKMNGLMVLQTLRANPDTEATPVVVLSNYMEPPLIQRALQLGAIEYVVKSQARPEQLVNAIPLWLEGKPALH